MPTSTPHLYAIAHGQDCLGPHTCYYCGAPADSSHTTREYVADTFTGRTTVARPGSACVCVGCVLCLRESATVSLCDGTERTISKAAVRACSWVVTRDRATAALKSHIAWLRGICLAPPKGPSAICLAVSGQKQLLYRTPLDLGGEVVSLLLEEECVRYRPCDLRKRLDLAMRVVAWSGKPALADPTVGLRSSTTEQACSADAWCQVYGEPLSRLAAFLCPSREEISRGAE